MKNFIVKNIKKAFVPYDVLKKFSWEAAEYGVPNVTMIPAITGKDLKGQLKPYGYNGDHRCIKDNMVYIISKARNGKVVAKRISMSERTRINYSKGSAKYGTSAIMAEILKEG